MYTNSKIIFAQFSTHSEEKKLQFVNSAGDANLER